MILTDWLNDRPAGGKPRASGDDPGLTVLGANPARAGMIPWTTRSPYEPARKPRASGDDPEAAARGVGVAE